MRFTLIIEDDLRGGQLVRLYDAEIELVRATIAAYASRPGRWRVTLERLR